MNEAEFEQHLASTLRLVLPFFQPAQVSSQRSFSIKFGHHHVLVDDQIPGERAKRSTYDVLLKINGSPLVLLELKRPGLPLSADDRDQGVSYARLTDPITPVTIVTNGQNFHVYDTYTKAEIENEVLDENFFTGRIAQASLLAKNAFKDALFTLIESDQRLLFSMLNTISKNTFAELTGAVSDPTRPIINDFSVPRALLGELQETVWEKQFVALTGDAYCGKTNLLYQYYQSAEQNEEAVLYINCADFHYSIFRKLANNLHSLLRFPVDELKLKEWLFLHFDEGTEKKITVIFDHVRADMDRVMMADLSEFLDVFKMDGNRIIVAVDQSVFYQLRFAESRLLNTMIGNNFREVQLGNFTTAEYFAANELLADHYQMAFAPGAAYTDVYRLPRIWRILVASSVRERPGEGFFALFKAVPGVEFLKVIQDTFQLDARLVSDFMPLIAAYIAGLTGLKDLKLKLMAVHLGIIREELALKYLDSSRINRLIQGGYLERRLVAGFEWVLVCKLPELLAGYAAQHLKDKYVPLFQADFDLAYREFIDDCTFLPYGELVACRLILDIGEAGDIDLFSDIINKLLNDEPKTEVDTSAKELELFVQKVGKVRLQMEEGVETVFHTNGFPYLVLAHVLSTGVGDGSAHPHHFRLGLISVLANKEYMIRKADLTFFHEGIPSFEIGRLGSVLQTNIGIIEPITQALHVNLLTFPEIFNGYLSFALKNKMYHLVHRMFIAANNTNSMEIGNKPLARVSRRIRKQYTALIPEIIAYGVAEDETNREERKRIEDRIRKLNIGNKP